MHNFLLFDLQGECQKVPASAATTVRYLCRRKYSAAGKALARIPTAKTALSKGCITTINQEARYFCKTTKYKGLGVFPFKIEDASQELEEKCPILCSYLRAVGSPTGGKRLTPKVYAAAMLLLNTRNNRVNALQKLVALLLWKGQLKSNMFKRLRMFGICASRAVALRTVDVSIKKYDQKLQRWRRQ
ncbi:uncharacterized protein [Amphiura filiformis]|uniref:uncharacterized protein n=1 Tax=Amphiura filiformis TaxID=82378 RepID=UPI003B21F5A3